MGSRIDLFLPGDLAFINRARILPEIGDGIVPVRNPLQPALPPPPPTGSGVIPDFLPDFLERPLEQIARSGAQSRDVGAVQGFLESITGLGVVANLGAGVGNLIFGGPPPIREGQIASPGFFPRGGVSMEPGKPIATRNGGMGLASAGAGRIVLNRWVANGRPFVMTSDANGKNKSIMVQRKDGSIKTYRPFRPIVIGKTLNVNSLSRLGTWMKRARKAFDKMERQVAPARRRGPPRKSTRVDDRDITVVRGG